MKNILGLGNATLDIINLVDHYPQEDEEIRVLSQRIATGGNVANTLTVLAQQGYDSFYAGMLADDADGHAIADKMQQQGIKLDYACWRAGGKSPVSYITLNRQNGSRTILHHRDLPELDAVHLASICWPDFDWLHVEGRNVEQTLQMLKACKLPQQRISIEIEKHRHGIELLIPFADVVMFSKDYMQHQGEHDPKLFLQLISTAYPGKQMTCTVGNQGAFAMDRNGELFFAEARKVKVVDSIGAGDTFNAGMIDGLLNGLDMEQCLHRANQLAGSKVSQQGFAGLGL